jgi:hypothetical protein
MDTLEPEQEPLGAPVHEPFRVHCYTKQRLALLYFPHRSPSSASNGLRRWIRRCAPLMEELERAGSRPLDKMLSAREVRLIVYYLGEPD